MTANQMQAEHMAKKQTKRWPPRLSMTRPIEGETIMLKMAMMPAVWPASLSVMWYVVMSHFGPKARKV